MQTLEYFMCLLAEVDRHTSTCGTATATALCASKEERRNGDG